MEGERLFVELNNDRDIIMQDSLTAEEFNDYFRNRKIGNIYNKPIYLKSSVRNFEYDKLECDAIFGYFNKVNSNDSYVKLIGVEDNFNDILCNIVLESAIDHNYYYTHWFNHFVPFNELAFSHFISTNVDYLDTIIHSYYYYLYSNPNNSSYYPMHYNYDNVVCMLDIMRYQCISLGAVDKFQAMFAGYVPSYNDYKDYIPDEVHRYHNLIINDFYYQLSDEHKLGFIL